MGLLLELRQRKRDSVCRSPEWPKRGGNENGGSPPYNTVLLLGRETDTSVGVERPRHHGHSCDEIGRCWSWLPSAHND